jgi:putative restriction endonuclease
MDRQGFIEFNTRLSPENSRKATSYAQAIRILDEVLAHQNVIDLHGQSLYDIPNAAIIEEVLSFVNDEVKKMKNNQQNIFDYANPDQRSYPLKSFCSAALKSLKKYAIYEQEVKTADTIVAQESNPQSISAKLIAHFDITKEGEDKISLTKQRKGQDYFRRMILANYGGRCALTGIDIPQLLLASHIIPWADKSHKKERLNPCNGICLSALYDKAFDQGLISISPDDYSVVISSVLRENETKEYFDKHFGIIIGKKLMMPTEYLPNRDFLAYHRDKVFVGG